MHEENTTEDAKTETHRANTQAMVDMYESYLATLDEVATSQSEREEIS